MAVNVFCYVEEHRGPSTFNVVVLARPGKDLKEVEKVSLRRNGTLKSEPIADWELEKARMAGAPANRAAIESTLYRAYRDRRDGRDSTAIRISSTRASKNPERQ